MLTLVGPESRRQRLALCYASHMDSLQLRDLPSETRQLFVMMRSIVAVEQGGSKAQYLEAVGELSDVQIEMLTCSIVELFDHVARYQPIGQQAEAQRDRLAAGRIRRPSKEGVS